MAVILRLPPIRRDPVRVQGGRTIAGKEHEQDAAGLRALRGSKARGRVGGQGRPEGLATMEVCDYRDVKGKFDKIVSVEMVEHVGIKNLDKYFVKVHELLADDGLFVLQ
jgi:hypothetical protein